MKQSVKPKKRKGHGAVSKAAEKLTRWMGSPASIVAHTAGFGLFFLLGVFGLEWGTVLLILTTIVSLEAIYLSLFIQMTVNRNTESLQEVEQDIEEIQEDVEEIQEDVDEMQEDVEEIQEDVEDISEDEKEDEVRDRDAKAALDSIQATVQKLMDDIEKLKKG